MANLSRDQALERIKQPKAQKEITRAKSKRQRHQLHTEPAVETGEYNLRDADNKFLSWVKTLLRSEENFSRFKDLYRLPVATNNLVESIYSEYEKIFNGENAFERFEFSTPELEQDFTDYRKKLGDYNFWETQGFETFKNSIDNILIVDLPRLTADTAAGSPRSSRPEPYYYILDIDGLVDIDNTRVRATDQVTGTEFYYFKCEYIIFRSDGKLYVFDDTFYRAYQEPEGKDPVLEAEIAHGLGYAPARSFWTTPLNSSCSFQKRGVITTALSDLDWLLFYTIAERYLQMYAPFPIYAIYKANCNYTAAGGKKKCVNGFLESEGARNLEGFKEPCPRCAAAMPVGPGNVLKLKAPVDKDDVDLLANPVKVIPAEVTSLEFVDTMLEKFRARIFTACVGRSQDPQNNQAKNEKQVESSFMSSESMLLKVKRNFEIAQFFALDTIARLRYGSDYKSGTINYGDEFFVKSEDRAIEEYKTAADSGLPEFDLAQRREDINIARYRNDPKQLERSKILRHLLPFPDLSIDKLQSFKKDFPELVSVSDMAIKINFTSFVDRFEREQANLVLFASAQTFDKKIALIREELNAYAKEYIDKAKAEAPKPEPDPAPGPGFPPAGDPKAKPPVPAAA
jgi:hypothetical protein